MLELEQAVEKILGSIPAPACEVVPLIHAHRRVVAETVVASVDLPAFDNSAMDGYAVLAKDLAGASAQNPVSLGLIGRSAAGEIFNGKLSTGQCVRIFTGSALPAGADAVVMQEDTRLDSKRQNEVLFLDSAKPWENVRFRGEDIKSGATIATGGEILGATQLGLLAACGLSQVKVAGRPSVALVATGSELSEAGSSPALEPGRIYESNRAALAPLVEKAGGQAVIFPIVRDEPEATRAALAQAFEQCDIVLTCGGVSVGEMDFVKSAFEELGGSLEFWKVAIRPGRPFVFGRYGNKFLFGLPGNPVSAFVTFLLLVRPALLRWQGAVRTQLPSSPAILAEPFSNPGDRRHFARVRLDGEGKVRPAGTQASHILSSLAAADGLLDVPAGEMLPAGTVVQILRWEDPG